MTPYKAICSFPPPFLVPFEPGTALDPKITRDDLIQLLCANIKVAQERMMHFYNQGHKEC
uniref:Uncharacterized protein n=1 Tax=Nymphaea colorata TaxID=210225 RepID=A0A5K0WSH8_9MAGN